MYKITSPYRLFVIYIKIPNFNYKEDKKRQLMLINGPEQLIWWVLENEKVE